MRKCWCSEPNERVEFSDIRMQLATQLEDITEDYSYLKLDAAKDYYNVQYGDERVSDLYWSNHKCTSKHYRFM